MHAGVVERTPYVLALAGPLKPRRRLLACSICLFLQYKAWEVRNTSLKGAACCELGQFPCADTPCMRQSFARTKRNEASSIRSQRARTGLGTGYTFDVRSRQAHQWQAGTRAVQPQSPGHVLTPGIRSADDACDAWVPHGNSSHPRLPPSLHPHHSSAHTAYSLCNRQVALHIHSTSTISSWDLGHSGCTAHHASLSLAAAWLHCS